MQAVTRATVWTNLENRLRDITQTQGDKYLACVHLYEIPRVSKGIAIESRLVVTSFWGHGAGDGELLFHGTEFLFGVMGKI